eukprot:SAG31_NODE_18059_length_648_cov_0.978142_1_plen_167_part_00
MYSRDERITRLVFEGKVLQDDAALLGSLGFATSGHISVVHVLTSRDEQELRPPHLSDVGPGVEEEAGQRAAAADENVATPVTTEPPEGAHAAAASQTLYGRPSSLNVQKVYWARAAAAPTPQCQSRSSTQSYSLPRAAATKFGLETLRKVSCLVHAWPRFCGAWRS